MRLVSARNRGVHHETLRRAWPRRRVFRSGTTFTNETRDAAEASRMARRGVRHATCRRTLASRRIWMSLPLLLTFVSTVAFAIQLLIFAYLYSSHRVRFFQYLLFAWGAYTLSKGLRLVDGIVLGVQHPSFATDLATVAAVGFTLAASFAHRWDYRLRRRDLLVG